MSKRKLLLADDSVTIQKVVNLTFADEGIEVVAAGDGDAALEKFAATAPDLVLADVNMPGLSGYQICERIKQNEATKNIPVILLVGSFEPFDEEEARRVGADDVLTKPFQSIRQLINKVSDLINANGAKETEGDETIVASENQETTQLDEARTESFDSFSAAGNDTFGDDENIQTDQIGSLPVYDAQKFESSFVSEPLEEDFNDGAETSFDAEIEKTESAEPDENFSADTESFSAEEFAETDFEETRQEARDESPSEKEFAFADAKDSAPEESAQDSKTVSTLVLDEMNLLEIPPVENSFSASNLSPEFVEAVARRVVENLSDRAVRDIAREVVPPMADLIIRQIAEEKFKQ